MRKIIVLLILIAIGFEAVAQNKYSDDLANSILRNRHSINKGLFTSGRFQMFKDALNTYLIDTQTGAIWSYGSLTVKEQSQQFFRPMYRFDDENVMNEYLKMVAE